MSLQEYRTDEAFKQAVEDRIRTQARREGQDVSRYRQLLVFERFLARVHAEFGSRAILKGGLALELRLHCARTTRDVDLRVSGNPEEVLSQFQSAMRLDLGDRMRFRIEIHPKHPVIGGDGVQYEGQRFRVQARLAGKPFGGPFGLDVAFGDFLYGAPEELEGGNFFLFAGISSAKAWVYPRETHIAEKLHAYTLLRSTENTRVRDLPDLALMAQTGSFTAGSMREAIQGTFDFRGTHSPPKSFPVPPESWILRYQELARENALEWSDLASVTVVVQAFLNPVLSGEEGIWDPEKWEWAADAT